MRAIRSTNSPTCQKHADDGNLSLVPERVVVHTQRAYLSACVGIEPAVCKLAAAVPHS